MRVAIALEQPSAVGAQRPAVGADDAAQGLLELGRLDAGVRSQVLIEVDAAELVRVSLQQSHHDPALMRVTGPDRGPAADLTVRVDKQQLGRALVNLFDNADRHAGGVRAVTVQRVRDRVRIDVDDRGDGVPEGDRERIFERFVRAGSRGSLPGSGLGLSIVAETASSLGGRVWCEDAPDGGARFSIELPAAPREVPVPDFAHRVGAR